MIWNKEMECADRQTMRRIQLERLQEEVRYEYEHVPYYAEKMDKAGVKPEDIRELEDIALLPFITKEDLADNYPNGLFAQPMESIVRIQSSSGTTGKPKILGYTERDMADWGEAVARGLVMAGASKGSVVQVAYGYGLFTGGLGAHAGAEVIGATVLPMSTGNTARQIMFMQDMKSDVICCTPSYAMTITEAVEKAGIDPEDLNLKGGLFGAEPWTQSMRDRIEKGLGIRAHDIYGLTEITGPGVSTSCEENNGMHINEDLFYPEIVDPNTLKPVPVGQTGELVFTTLRKQGMPMIRYRTRDICRLMDDPCPCGRTTIRMDRVLGRTDDMLIVKGVNVFPSQVEIVIGKFRELTMNYKLLVDRKGNSDTIELMVEFADGLIIDDIDFVEHMRKQVEHALRETLQIGCKVRFLNAGTLPRSEGKAVRIEDRRRFE